MRFPFRSSDKPSTIRPILPLPKESPKPATGPTRESLTPQSARHYKRFRRVAAASAASCCSFSSSGIEYLHTVRSLRSSPSFTPPNMTIIVPCEAASMPGPSLRHRHRSTLPAPLPSFLAHRQIHSEALTWVRDGDGGVGEARGGELEVVVCAPVGALVPGANRRVAQQRLGLHLHDVPEHLVPVEPPEQNEALLHRELARLGVGRRRPRGQPPPSHEPPAHRPRGGPAARPRRHPPPPARLGVPARTLHPTSVSPPAPGPAHQAHALPHQRLTVPQARPFPPIARTLTLRRSCCRRPLPRPRPRTPP